MSAARNTSTKALRNLSAHSHQVRHLHMTPTATFPSRALTSEKNIMPSLPKDLSGLRAECSRRGVSSAGSKDELIARLTSPATRTFVTDTTKRPTSATEQAQGKRHINTSRALKRPNDTSTMDFAYLPEEPAANPADNVNIRVPLLPQNYTPTRTGVHAPETPSYDAITIPSIVTAAADSTHISAPSWMTEVHDNTAAPVDFHALAEKMEGAVGKVSERMREGQGTFRQFWEGVKEDVMGPKPGIA